MRIGRHNTTVRFPSPNGICRAPTKRVVGNMAALSGAQGISYMEYSTQQR